MINIKNFIDGQFIECSSTLDSFNPATGKVNAKIPDGTEKDVELAVESSEKAFLSYVFFFLHLIMSSKVYILTKLSENLKCFL